MSDYRIKAGHDAALIDLIVVNPQPKGRPVRGTERTYGLSRAHYDLGLYAEWVFELIADATEYGALLTTLGLGSLNFAPVTVYTLNQRLVYTRYNATIELPQMGADANWDTFLRNVVFRFTELELAA